MDFWKECKMVRRLVLHLIIISCIASLMYLSLPSNAIETGQAEIVITDIWLDPEHPQAGDKVTIFGNVYNGGTFRTEYYAKVVTVGFLIDGELRKIAELGNVNPGSTNNVKVSTGSLWEAEWGKHNMTVIIDYHNTLPDQYDNPTNNIIEKTFIIEPVGSSQINFDITPSYIIHGQVSELHRRCRLSLSRHWPPGHRPESHRQAGDSRHP